MTSLLLLCLYADVHTIAVIKAKENYENILTGFQQSFAEINELIKNPEITVEGRKYNLLFFLCCDYKVYQLYI